MRILFSSLSYPGHLNPLLPYAKVLRDRGHEVRIAAPKAAAEKVQKAGLEHVAYEDTSYDPTPGARSAREWQCYLISSMTFLASAGKR